MDRMVIKSNTVKGINISEISLGTVQLGLNYGINNQNGKPSQSQAEEILSCAIEHGINTLDTAAQYGDSEQVIGKWLAGFGGEKPFIVTKAKELDHTSLEALRKSLKMQVEQSKENLGLTRLPMLMLHSCDEYTEDAENMKKVFGELKENGDILFSGISAYSHHDYTKIAESGFDAVQIPLNLFDWRQIDNGGVEKLRESGMMIFVRSVYLQGLVFKNPDFLDEKMSFCKDALVKFRGLCEKFGLSPAQLALSFALSLKGVTSLVLGSETKEQVIQNAELYSKCVRLSDGQMEEIHDCFKDIDRRIVTPSQW